MAQRPTRGSAPIQRQNPASHEDDAAPRQQEKPQGQGTIAVVKSKIRERDAPRQEEDPLASTRVTPSKIASKSKRIKRGSSTENIPKEEMPTIKKSDIKPEKAEEDNVKSEPDQKLEIEPKLEENQTTLAESKSKKSMAKITQSRKSLGPTEDEQTEGVAAKKSEMKKEVEGVVSTGPALSSTTLSVVETTEKKSEIQANLTESTVKRSIPKPQKTQGERRNYLANLFPQPLDEDNADDEEPKPPKDQEKPKREQSDP